MSPFLRGSNSTLKSNDNLWELADFIKEQQGTVSQTDRKIFVTALRAQRNNNLKVASENYYKLTNKYESQVVWDNINELV